MPERYLCAAFMAMYNEEENGRMVLCGANAYEMKYYFNEKFNVNKKYDSFMITFTEVPDELSLCINCTCCPLRCKGCFEPWLQEDRGAELTFAEIDNLLYKCRGIL